MAKRLKLNIPEINNSLLNVEKNWQSIDDKLEELHIGRKDKFDVSLRENLMCAYEYLDSALLKNIEPFSNYSFPIMLELNNLVHFGEDFKLRSERNQFISYSADKFHKHIGVLYDWYKEHKKRNDNALKIAAEIYVGIVGHPQLFDEGNHRTGSIISNWINMYYGYPPFILSVNNAIAYFEPSSEIKFFADKSTWRGRNQLPKYKKSFKKFWEEHIDKKYTLE